MRSLKTCLTGHSSRKGIVSWFCSFTNAWEEESGVEIQPCWQEVVQTQATACLSLFHGVELWLGWLKGKEALYLRFLAVRILQPAVRVRNLASVIIVHLRTHQNKLTKNRLVVLSHSSTARRENDPRSCILSPAPVRTSEGFKLSH